MPKEIEGIRVENAARRQKRGAKAHKKLKRDTIPEMIPGVPNFATRQLQRNAKYQETLDHQNTRANRELVANAILSQKARKHYSALPALDTPKHRLRTFLNAELSWEPHAQGRYAVFAGNSIHVPPNEFIHAYTSILAAQSAVLSVYKQGDYLMAKMIDRGPAYIFETLYTKRV